MHTVYQTFSENLSISSALKNSNFFKDALSIFINAFFSIIISNIEFSAFLTIFALVKLKGKFSIRIEYYSPVTLFWGWSPYNTEISILRILLQLSHRKVEFGD